jgi:methionyl-tRNA formyltransferase
MRVVIMTAWRHGTASRCFVELVKQPGVEVVGVIYCAGHYRTRKAKLKRQLRKARRIGPFGAVAGLWLRRCYTGPPTEDIFDLAGRHDMPVEITPRTNAPRTRELMRAAKADLGLSLGNDFIAPKVFEIPRFGMLNVHGEVLPRFQGAASVIWPIHEGVRETGFTIHQVDRHIDTGPILYIERFPIRVLPGFAETVRANVAEISLRIPPALARVVGGYEEFKAKGTVQRGGQGFTTPTFRQFLHMLRQHRRMLREDRG